MFRYDHDFSGWDWFAMSAGMALFWVLVIAVGVLLFRVLSRPEGAGTPPRSVSIRPEEVLAERFARGEIDEDEYRRRLSVLSGYAEDSPRPRKV
ncbi:MULTISPECIES: SHOCT domain-containing protein [unclassified Streptomyces]|uniref:SHOCT domain-containing protein n=1 Tax=unclassified Streptomyces TaxID=2593676 RepID=UPI00278C6367|nr:MULTISPECIES: SHOCT domain-containing protein [unclassified Streptomyces]